MTTSEIETLTGYRQPARQAAAVAAMGLEFRRNARGQVVILRAAVEKLLSSKVPVSSDRLRSRPNWAAASKESPNGATKDKRS